MSLIKRSSRERLLGEKRKPWVPPGIVWRDAERSGSNLDFEARQSVTDRRYHGGWRFSGEPKKI